MLGKPEIRFCDELPVEALLTLAGFIARYEHENAISSCIASKLCWVNESDKRRKRVTIHRGVPPR